MIFPTLVFSLTEKNIKVMIKKKFTLNKQKRLNEIWVVLI